MVFSSLLFLFRFLPLMLLLYYAAPARHRNFVLFLGSLFFYGWGEPVYVSLLLFSTVVDFFLGKLVGRLRISGRTGAARLAVASSAAVNLGLLSFFKYGEFLVLSFNRIFGLSLPFPHLALPIGISFYTFQTMSYTIDVYRGRAKVQDNLAAFGAYVSMFPQLVAGPIVRYHTVATELSGRRENLEDFASGVRRFVAGLGKKVLIANQMGAVWQEIQGIVPGDRTVVMAWAGLFAFGMQIYYDFSGYSDMAIGLGRMMGFHFPENFRYPYTSKSITEFWRRWHISLGDWFKEYVYIPLGGNRNGMGRQVRNILAVWLLTGIWHGAGWNFLLWGLYFGLLLLLEKFALRQRLERLPTFARHIYALLLIFAGWILFSFEHLGDGVLYAASLVGVGVGGAAEGRTWYLIASNALLMAAAAAGSGPWISHWFRKVRERRPAAAGLLEIAGCAVLLAASTAYLVNAGYNPFLYFRF